MDSNIRWSKPVNSNTVAETLNLNHIEYMGRIVSGLPVQVDMPWTSWFSNPWISHRSASELTYFCISDHINLYQFWCFSILNFCSIYHKWSVMLLSWSWSSKDSQYYTTDFCYSFYILSSKKMLQELCL